MQASGVEQARLARDSYGYLHLPMVAGIVLFALGLKTTLGHVGEALETVLGRGVRVLRYREDRIRVRHPELAA